MTALIGIESFGNDLYVRLNDTQQFVAHGISSTEWACNVHISVDDDGNAGQPNPDPGGGSGGSSGGKYSISAAMINAGLASQGANPALMVGTPEQIAASFNNAIKATMPDVLSSKARAGCLVGECMQETDYYKTTEEYSHSGPYAPYWGRGFIQLTWRSNYAAFGQWCVDHGLLSDPNQFVDEPAQVAQLQWAPYTALFYFTRNSWARKNLWEWCDSVSSPWYEISAAINYGNPLDGYVGPSYGLRGEIIDACIGAM